MDYIIGAGALLETGNGGSITPAALHAQVDPALAERVRAAAIDFESASLSTLRRLMVVGRGWDPATVRSSISEPLRKRGICSLADVLRVLARAAGAPEVHLFAHWLPDDETCAALREEGIAIVAHPLESIAAASLVASQRREQWPAHAA
jgi:hypothetical protein